MTASIHILLMYLICGTRTVLGRHRKDNAPNLFLLIGIDRAELDFHFHDHRYMSMNLRHPLQKFTIEN